MHSFNITGYLDKILCLVLNITMIMYLPLSSVTNSIWNKVRSPHKRYKTSVMDQQETSADSENATLDAGSSAGKNSKLSRKHSSSTSSIISRSSNNLSSRRRSESPSVVYRSQAKKATGTTISSSNALAGRSNSFNTSPTFTSPPSIIVGLGMTSPVNSSSSSLFDYHGAGAEEPPQETAHNIIRIASPTVDSAMMSQDYTIDVPLRMIDTNLSSFNYFPETLGNDNENSDVWSYNPEEGHTYITNETKKMVRFT